MTDDDVSACATASLGSIERDDVRSQARLAQLSRAPPSRNCFSNSGPRSVTTSCFVTWPHESFVHHAALASPNSTRGSADPLTDSVRYRLRDESIFSSRPSTLGIALAPTRSSFSRRKTTYRPQGAGSAVAICTEGTKTWLKPTSCIAPQRAHSTVGLVGSDQVDTRIRPPGPCEWYDGTSVGGELMRCQSAVYPAGSRIRWRVARRSH